MRLLAVSLISSLAFNACSSLQPLETTVCQLDNPLICSDANGVETKIDIQTAIREGYMAISPEDLAALLEKAKRERLRK
jgi:hypothetical protein